MDWTSQQPMRTGEVYKLPPELIPWSTLSPSPPLTSLRQPSFENRRVRTSGKHYYNTIKNDPIKEPEPNEFAQGEMFTSLSLQSGCSVFVKRQDSDEDANIMRHSSIPISPSPFPPSISAGIPLQRVAQNNATQNNLLLASRATSAATRENVVPNVAPMVAPIAAPPPVAVPTPPQVLDLSYKVGDKRKLYDPDAPLDLSVKKTKPEDDVIFMGVHRKSPGSVSGSSASGRSSSNGNTHSSHVAPSPGFANHWFQGAGSAMGGSYPYPMYPTPDDTHMGVPDSKKSPGLAQRSPYASADRSVYDPVMQKGRMADLMQSTILHNAQASSRSSNSSSSGTNSKGSFNQHTPYMFPVMPGLLPAAAVMQSKSTASTSTTATGAVQGQPDVTTSRNPPHVHSQHSTHAQKMLPTASNSRSLAYQDNSIPGLIGLPQHRDYQNKSSMNHISRQMTKPVPQATAAAAAAAAQGSLVTPYHGSSARAPDVPKRHERKMTSTDSRKYEQSYAVGAESRKDSRQALMYDNSLSSASSPRSSFKETVQNMTYPLYRKTPVSDQKSRPTYDVRGVSVHSDVIGGVHVTDTHQAYGGSSRNSSHKAYPQAYDARGLKMKGPQHQAYGNVRPSAKPNTIRYDVRSTQVGLSDYHKGYDARNMSGFPSGHEQQLRSTSGGRTEKQNVRVPSTCVSETRVHVPTPLPHEISSHQNVSLLMHHLKTLPGPSEQVLLDSQTPPPPAASLTTQPPSQQQQQQQQQQQPLQQQQLQTEKDFVSGVPRNYPPISSCMTQFVVNTNPLIEKFAGSSSPSLGQLPLGGAVITPFTAPDRIPTTNVTMPTSSPRDTSVYVNEPSIFRDSPKPESRSGSPSVRVKSKKDYILEKNSPGYKYATCGQPSPGDASTHSPASQGVRDALQRKLQEKPDAREKSEKPQDTTEVGDASPGKTDSFFNQDKNSPAGLHQREDDTVYRCESVLTNPPLSATRVADCYSGSKTTTVFATSVHKHASRPIANVPPMRKSIDSNSEPATCSLEDQKLKQQDQSSKPWGSSATSVSAARDPCASRPELAAYLMAPKERYKYLSKNSPLFENSSNGVVPGNNSIFATDNKGKHTGDSNNGAEQYIRSEKQEVLTNSGKDTSAESRSKPVAQGRQKGPGSQETKDEKTRKDNNSAPKTKHFVTKKARILKSTAATILEVPVVPQKSDFVGQKDKVVKEQSAGSKKTKTKKKDAVAQAKTLKKVKQIKQLEKDLGGKPASRSHKKKCPPGKGGGKGRGSGSGRSKAMNTRFRSTLRKTRSLSTYNKNAAYEEELRKEEERRMFLRAMRKEANYYPGGLEPADFDRLPTHKRKDLLSLSHKTRVSTPRKCKEKSSKRSRLKSPPLSPAFPEKELPRKSGHGVKDKKIKFRKSHKARDSKRNAQKLLVGPDSLDDGELYPGVSVAEDSEHLSTTVGTPASDDVIPACDVTEVSPQKDPAAPELVKRLVVCKETGETLLHKAARLGHLDVVRYCIESKSHDVNVRDNAGYTPLHESCVSGHVAIAKYLISKGADVNASALVDGTRPIHDAVDNDNLELLRLLLSCGANPRMTTYSGRTPLKIAHTPRMRNFLLGYIADVNGREGTLYRWEAEFVPECEQELENKCGAPVLTDAPPDGEEDVDDDVTIDFSDEMMLPVYYVTAVPRRGPRNYHLLKNVADRINTSLDDFLILNGDLEFAAMPYGDLQDQIQDNLFPSTDALRNTVGNVAPETEVTLVEISEALNQILDVQSESFSVQHSGSDESLGPLTLYHDVIEVKKEKVDKVKNIKREPVDEHQMTSYNSRSMSSFFFEDIPTKVMSPILGRLKQEPSRCVGKSPCRSKGGTSKGGCKKGGGAKQTRSRPTTPVSIKGLKRNASSSDVSKLAGSSPGMLHGISKLADPVPTGKSPARGKKTEKKVAIKKEEEEEEKEETKAASASTTSSSVSSLGVSESHNNHSANTSGEKIEQDALKIERDDTVKKEITEEAPKAVRHPEDKPVADSGSADGKTPPTITAIKTEPVTSGDVTEGVTEVANDVIEKDGGVVVPKLEQDKKDCAPVPAKTESDDSNENEKLDVSSTAVGLKKAGPDVKLCSSPGGADTATKKTTSALHVKTETSPQAFEQESKTTVPSIKTHAPSITTEHGSGTGGKKLLKLMKNNSPGSKTAPTDTRTHNNTPDRKNSSEITPPPQPIKTTSEYDFTEDDKEVTTCTKRCLSLTKDKTIPSFFKLKKERKDEFNTSKFSRCKKEAKQEYNKTVKKHVSPSSSSTASSAAAAGSSPAAADVTTTAGQNTTSKTASQETEEGKNSTTLPKCQVQLGPLASQPGGPPPGGPPQHGRKPNTGSYKCVTTTSPDKPTTDVPKTFRNTNNGLRKSLETQMRRLQITDKPLPLVLPAAKVKSRNVRNDKTSEGTTGSVSEDPVLPVLEKHEDDDSSQDESPPCEDMEMPELTRCSFV